MAKKKQTALNPSQERFCILYASDQEFFANGTQSYIEAYNIDIKRKGAYLAARVSAHEMLTKRKILDRINEILEMQGLNDPYVDKQLEFLITQNADLSTKIASIREYNQLKGRITKKVKVGLSISDLLDEQEEGEGTE